ncbi:hypothetical protein RA970_000057 [Cronobacter dublinensis]|nr:hypothetical protein [Cronobacter dublinensis]ELY4576248.1 hypothetical protein [Cronobacter turicensis]
MTIRFSLADIQKNNIISNAHNVIAAVSSALESYQNFKFFVRELLDDAIKKIEQNANKMGFELTEDQLTLHLLALIDNEFIGVRASHEVNQRGHCDITIQLGKFIWHGEAKKHSSAYSYLFKGYSQLTERYSSGTVDSASGGVIIYTKNKNCSDVMKNYIAYLRKGAPKIHEAGAINVSPCANNPLVFYSTHKHTVTKLDYEVIHYPVNLYHNPKE